MSSWSSETKNNIAVFGAIGIIFRIFDPDEGTLVMLATSRLERHSRQHNTPTAQ